MISGCAVLAVTLVLGSSHRLHDAYHERAGLSCALIQGGGVREAVWNTQVVYWVGDSCRDGRGDDAQICPRP